MNAKILSLILLLSFTVVFQACKEDDSDDSPNNTNNNNNTEKSFFVKIDGQDFNHEVFTAYAFGPSLNLQASKLITIDGEEKMSTVSILLKSDTEKGTYRLEPEVEQEQVIVQYTPAAGGLYVSFAGKVTIDEHDRDKKWISGTFNADVTSARNDQYSLTEGSFSIKY